MNPTYDGQHYVMPRQADGSDYSEDWQDGYRCAFIHVSSHGYACMSPEDPRDFRRGMRAALRDMRHFIKSTKNAESA